nr:coproporphyrinogen dehydrogenase HemZ [Eubacterium sp.]
MIRITSKDNEFSYDLKALAMAFYPAQECVTKEEASWLDKQGYTMCLEMDGELVYEDFLPMPYTKNQVKQRFYRFLSKYSGKSLPWGILTGIRPAKIALRMLMAGEKKVDILDKLKNEYLCCEEKADLAMAVAEKEYALTGAMDHENSVSIYIGIPFCPSICAYCSFSSYPYKQYEKKVDEYLEALEKEITFVAEQIRHKTVQSVYIGGGTPTSLNEEQFERLLQMVERHLPMREDLEYTVEAGRPDSITRGKLVSMKNHHVTRISINPQTMKQRTLDLLGRRHTVEEIHTVYDMARELGFDNINMDLIVGLPEETPEDFQRTLAEVHAMGPDSITVHTLVIKRASRMRREQLEQGGEVREEDDYIPQMQDLSEQFCREHGYEPYYMYRQKNKAVTTRNTNQENVAYAKPGKECLYNIFMMEELQSILALGSGGSSKYVFHGEDRMERVENVKSVDDYINRIEDMLNRKLKFSL